MCGGFTTEKRLTATGILNSLRGSAWLDIAEELASLTLSDFNKLMQAFKLYREAKEDEKEPQNALPPRVNNAKKLNERKKISPLHEE